MTFAGVVTRRDGITVVVLALVLTLVAACSEDSTGNEAPPAESPTVSPATRVPGDTEALLYYIENPVLECRDGASWLSIQQLGYLLGDDTVIRASPITPGRAEGTFDSVGGYQSLDTVVTSSTRAVEVFPDREYIDDTTMTATVEAALPAFLTDSDQPQFVVLITGTYDETGEWFSSNSLILETSAARC